MNILDKQRQIIMQVKQKHYKHNVWINNKEE